MRGIFLILFLLLPLLIIAVPTREGILQTLGVFLNDFKVPRMLDIGKNLSYSGFTDDVVGRLDITDTYKGNELLTEYIFGFLGTQSEKNHTILLGYPVNQTAVYLSVDPPVASVSTITNFDFRGRVGVVPVQIDSWFRFDDNHKITQWDGVFRRFARMMSEIQPLIAKDVKAELKLPASTSIQSALKKRAAIDVCDAHQAFCTGKNRQYKDKKECMKVLEKEKRLGDWSQVGMDSVLCRYVHHGMLRFRPTVHCPHVGPTGGDMCQNRSFKQDTLVLPFKYPFANAG